MITAKRSKPWLKIWLEQKGGMTLLAAGGIFAAVLILFMVANIGNIYATKAKLNDAAKMMADVVLSNQLKSPTKPTQTKTAALIKKLDKDAGLKATLGKVTYQFQFGYTVDNGVHFIPIAQKNPTPADFYTASGNNPNTMPAIAFEIRTPILNIGNFFNLLGKIKGRSIRFLNIPFKKIVIDKNNRKCICQPWAEQFCAEQVCADNPLPQICVPHCVTPAMIAACDALNTLSALMTLNPTDFLKALRCAFSDMIFVMHTMVVTAWNWAWTASSVMVKLI